MTTTALRRCPCGPSVGGRRRCLGSVPDQSGSPSPAATIARSAHRWRSARVVVSQVAGVNTDQGSAHDEAVARRSRWVSAWAPIQARRRQQAGTTRRVSDGDGDALDLRAPRAGSGTHAGCVERRVRPERPASADSHAAVGPRGCARERRAGEGFFGRIEGRHVAMTQDLGGRGLRNEGVSSSLARPRRRRCPAVPNIGTCGAPHPCALRPGRRTTRRRPRHTMVRRRATEGGEPGPPHVGDVLHPEGGDRPTEGALAVGRPRRRAARSARAKPRRISPATRKPPAGVVMGVRIRSRAPPRSAGHPSRYFRATEGAGSGLGVEPRCQGCSAPPVQGLGDPRRQLGVGAHGVHGPDHCAARGLRHLGCARADDRQPALEPRMLHPVIETPPFEGVDGAHACDCS